jgi:hypothetical protein
MWNGAIRQIGLILDKGPSFVYPPSSIPTLVVPDIEHSWATFVWIGGKVTWLMQLARKSKLTTGPSNAVDGVVGHDKKQGLVTIQGSANDDIGGTDRSVQTGMLVIKRTKDSDEDSNKMSQN